MSEFSDQYFRDLAPRQRRYDTPVSDQLYFCVFPNGVKSWVYLYEVDGHIRRRTIGLFPDMGYEEALRSLDPNRRIAAVDASEHRQPRADRPRSLTLTIPPALQQLLERVSLRDVAVTGVTAILALGVFMLLGGPDEPERTPPVAATADAGPPAGEQVADAEPAASGAIEPAGSEEADSEMPAAEVAAASVDGGGAPEAGTAEEGEFDALVDGPEPAAGVGIEGAPDDDEVPATETVGFPGLRDGLVENSVFDEPDVPAPSYADPEDGSSPADIEDLGLTASAAAVWAEAEASGDMLLETPAPTGEDDPAVDETRTGIGVSGPEDAAADATDAPAPGEPAETATATPPADETAQVAAVDAAESESAAEETPPVEETVEETVDAADQAPADDSAPAGETAPIDVEPEGTADAAETGTVVLAAASTTASGYVQRAMLANDIVDHEPSEALSDVVAVPPEGDRLVYFFTELRRSAGQTVVHRWLNAGVITAEREFEVRDDWRWRVYSARRIGANQAGDWRVEALTPDGQLLASQNFTVTVAEDAPTAITLADEPAPE